MNTTPILLDCTLRDGGYHNNWDFDSSLIQEYLNAVAAAGVDYVEIGFRSLKNEGFKGGAAFSTDSWIRQYDIPSTIKIAVMINAAELFDHEGKLRVRVLECLFHPAEESPVSMVRIACHARELSAALPASSWLREKGYQVAFNLMQVADRTSEEIQALAKEVSKYPVDVLYFADSLGTLSPETTRNIVDAFRSGWSGPLGVHTHDNMSRALVNSVEAVSFGVTWVDGTITGMGRGPGNARTELLVLEFEDLRGHNRNLTGLLSLIRRHFAPMQTEYGWGANAYYYLSGKYGIHPTFVQEMLNDARYQEEDVLAAIDHIQTDGGKSFDRAVLDTARNFYRVNTPGTWNPRELIEGRDVLLLASGPGIRRYGKEIESFIAAKQPVVLSLNTQTNVSQDFITASVASHPLRLLAECETYAGLSHPLIAPVSALPDEIRTLFKGVRTLDFGIGVNGQTFEFHQDLVVVPRPLVLAYTLGVVVAGAAKRVYLAGFDGYPQGDPRNEEVEWLLGLYQSQEQAIELISITPTRYSLKSTSIYFLQENE
jgi:4-hydroxy 2-oxovalerate aldolase